MMSGAPFQDAATVVHGQHPIAKGERGDRFANEPRVTGKGGSGREAISTTRVAEIGEGEQRRIRAARDAEGGELGASFLRQLSALHVNMALLSCKCAQPDVELFSYGILNRISEQISDVGSLRLPEQPPLCRGTLGLASVLTSMRC